MVEVHGCAHSVQILVDAAVVAAHPRHTQERLLLEPAHYEGLSTERVIAPPPLGKLGMRLQELGKLPVAHRSIEQYALLAEVAR
jgi:hypothetical protein